MGKQVKTRAIVLHEMPIGDYDKRLILMTKEHGKVTAFVKGARRANNRLLASSQIFAYSDFVLGQSRNHYNVYQASLIESFHRLRLDVEDLTYAMYLLEFVDYVCNDELENQELMHWLLISLKVIEKKYMPTRLVIRVFELKAMAILGFTPWLNDCVECHREDVVYFSPGLGGVVCDHKSHGVTDLIKVHSGTLHAMRFILTEPMKKIYGFELEHEELIELEQIMTQFIHNNINKRFKTMAFLKEL